MMSQNADNDSQQGMDLVCMHVHVLLSTYGSTYFTVGINATNASKFTHPQK